MRGMHGTQVGARGGGAHESQSGPCAERDARAQCKPSQHDLRFHCFRFARMADSVVMEPSPLQGWFGEALWRCGATAATPSPTGG